MYIDLKKTIEGTSSYKTILKLSAELAETGGVSVDVPTEIMIRRLGSQIFVELLYDATVVRDCGRCLESFTEKVEGVVEFILLAEGEEDMETDSVDCYFYETEEDEIDFSQTLYDDIMIQVPIRALCRYDCPGFSVEDSKDVEEKEVTDTDPRWAALSKLKKSN
jgi:uncharacterized protein